VRRRLPNYTLSQRRSDYHYTGFQTSSHGVNIFMKPSPFSEENSSPATEEYPKMLQNPKVYCLLNNNHLLLHILSQSNAVQIPNRISLSSILILSSNISVGVRVLRKVLKKFNSGRNHECLLAYLLTHGAEPKWCSHSRTQQFVEPEGSIPCSQEPSTGPYPQPYQINPHHSILSF
jgi:hypothetical protein